MDKKIFPRQIWMVDFKENNNSLTVGKHPALLLDCAKHIIKNKQFLHVAPLTSKDINKLLRSHVLLDGFGLDRLSKVQLEQVITVSSEDLLWCVGQIDDIEKNKEIDEKIRGIILTESEGQLNLGNVIDIFRQGIENEVDKEELNNLVKLMRDKYYIERNDVAAEYLANEIIFKAKEAKINRKNKNSYLWYGHYTLSVLNYDRKYIQYAINCTEECLKYVSSNDSKHHYALTLWNLGNCYTEINKEDEAVEIFKYLARYYKLNNMPKERASCIFNIFFCRKDIDKLYRIREYFINHSDNVWYNNITKDFVLNNIDEEIERLRNKLNIN